MEDSEKKLKISEENFRTFFETIDDSWSAHFEHTIAITEDGPNILSKIN